MHILFQSRVQKTNGDHYSKRRISEKKSIELRQAKSCDLFLQSQVTTHVQK